MRFPLGTLSSAVLLLTTQVSAIAYETRFDQVFWDDDTWSLSTTKLDQGHYQSRISLANGYLGINLAGLGPFFEVDTSVNGDNINGWPLFERRQTFAGIAGFWDYQDRTNGSNYPWLYQYGGESVVSGVPHWAGLAVEANGAILNASTPSDHIVNFLSKLDLASGHFLWSYDWKPGGSGEPINIEYSMFVHKLYVNKAAVQLKLTASSDSNVTVYDVFEGDCAVRSDPVDKNYETDSPTIWSAVKPNGIDDDVAYVYSTLTGNDQVDFSTRAEVDESKGLFGGNGSSIAQSVDINLSAYETAVVAKFVGSASLRAFGSSAQELAYNASREGASMGFSELAKSHIEEWKTVLTVDSVDSYYLPDGSLPNDTNIRELQITSVTNPFHILQNTVGPNAIAAANNNSVLGTDSIPVGGLGSSSYAGMVFWDAEVWMAPGLQVSHPQHIKQIPQFRVKLYPQAQKNIEMAYSSSQNTTYFSEGGAVYPWTSGRFGNCTGTGPCFDYEYHLNGDIAISMFNQYITSGDAQYFNESLLPVVRSIAHFYAELVTYNETSNQYALKNATDPDEYANNVDDAGFTTALIQSHLNETNEISSWFGFAANDTWTDRSSKMRLPTNPEAQIVLEYNTMNGSISVKQADVVLIDDILHYDDPYALSDLDYYAARQSLNGPGMTYGVFSIVANEISPSGCSSYTYDLYGSQPYTRGPWFQYSEQLLDDYEANGGTHPAYPFLTGMGGANRVAIFGYLGLRLYFDRLHIDPSLPPQIPAINYRTIYWQGYGINATSNTTHTVLTRLPAEDYTLPNANATFATQPIPVTVGESSYELGSDPLVVENRQIGQIATDAGNVVQCRENITSTAAYLPGQFPLSAIDGAISTKWQPAFANSTAILSVDLGWDNFVPITEIHLDWGTTPPTSWMVFFSNETGYPTYDQDEIVNVSSSTNVTISQPYQPDDVFKIQTYVGNQTNQTLPEPIYTGRWVHLAITGNSDNPAANASGATVAEWALISTEDPSAKRKSREVLDSKMRRSGNGQMGWWGFETPKKPQ